MFNPYLGSKYARPPENHVNDCEVVKIDFDAIPSDIYKIVVICTIYEADKRRQTFHIACVLLK